MKNLIIIIGLCSAFSLSVYSPHQQSKKTIVTKNIKLAAPEVQKAIVALNEQDAKTWYALFTDDASFSDDNREIDFKKWCDRELFSKSKCYVTRIDKVENQGFNIYCLFHSDNYGDFKTYMNFIIEGDTFNRLEVGQVDY